MNLPLAYFQSYSLGSEVCVSALRRENRLPMNSRYRAFDVTPLQDVNQNS